MKEKFEGARVPSKGMKDLVTINNRNLEVKEFKGQRVITFKEIDSVHERVEGTAKRNFNDNKEHFIQNEDYFKMSYKEFSTKYVPNSKGGNPNNEIVLLTESGYLMLVKSLSDDLAWTVQRELVNKYFKAKDGQGNLKSPEEIIIMQMQEQLKIKKQLNEVNHHALQAKSEVEKLEKDFIDYKENDTLSTAQCDELADLVKKIGVARLGGKDTKAYKDKAVRMSLYKNIWGNVKTEFNVTRYKQIKRKYFIRAKEIVMKYEVPTFLKEEIRTANNQIDFLKNIQPSVNQAKFKYKYKE